MKASRTPKAGAIVAQRVCQGQPANQRARDQAPPLARATSLPPLPSNGFHSLPRTERPLAASIRQKTCTATIGDHGTARLSLAFLAFVPGRRHHDSIPGRPATNYRVPIPTTLSAPSFCISLISSRPPSYSYLSLLTSAYGLYFDQYCNHPLCEYHGLSLCVAAA